MVKYSYKIIIKLGIEAWTSGTAAHVFYHSANYFPIKTTSQSAIWRRLCMWKYKMYLGLKSSQNSTYRLVDA